MNSKRIIHIVFVVSIILVLGFAVTPASADSPVENDYPIDETYIIKHQCDFNIVSHRVGILHDKVWFDENGDLYRAHQNWEVTETWEANGKTLEFTYNYPARGWFETYGEGYAFYMGAEMFTLPHEGVVYSATGLETYKMIRDEDGNITITDLLKQVGNWETDWPAICEYFET
jgi:hypothetical protein